MERNEKGQFVRGSKIKDLTGEKFNMFTVLEFSHVDYGEKYRRTYWVVQCECGTIKTIRADQLKTTKSCGCHKRKVDSEKAKKLVDINRKYDDEKSLSRHPLYHVWRGMNSRCYDSKDNHYSRYGGRGISICKEWKDDFRTFYDWGMNNGYSEGLEIDRIDNDGNYEPSNCRWVTRKENANNRSTTIKIPFKGYLKSVTEWSEVLGIDPTKMYYLHDKKNIPYETIIEVLYANTELSL